MCFSCFFFCKQKTAYELRISDWSSDVCSSDLPEGDNGRAGSGSASSLAKIDPDRLQLGVFLHRVQRLVAAEAGLLVAAEGRRHVAGIEAVHPPPAGAQRLGGAVRLLDFAGPHLRARTSVVWGKRWSVRVVLCGRLLIKTKL